MHAYRERHGLWWLPGFPDKKVKGRLSWSGEQGGRLELQGTFPDPAIRDCERVPVRPYATDIILGELASGQPCTLCKNVANTLGAKPRFHSIYLMEGAHFHSPGDIKASNATFRMQHLEEWTDQMPLVRDEEVQKDPFQIRPKRVTSPFRPIHIVDSAISQPRAATLSLTVTYNPIFGFKKFTFEQTCRMLVEASQEPFEFQELLTLIRDCTNFFTLLMAEGAGAFDVWFWLKQTDVPVTRVRLLYPGLKSPAQTEIHPTDMLLSLPELKDPSTVLATWIDKGPSLRRAANWLILTMGLKGWSAETEFLSYVQAAETIHRVLKPPGKFVGAAEYSIVETALVSALPPGTNNDLKQKVKQMLEHGNEFSLRRRLRELLKTFYSTRPESYEKWIERVVDTRNYFIHNDPGSESRAASGQELFNLCAGLRALVASVLLHSAGVPPSTILDAVRNQGWIIG